MAQYKLTYFTYRGKAELLRYIFAYMNVEYEDHKIKWEDWSKHKASYPFGKLPVLEFNGGVYYQTLAIGRYLARKAGLNGKSELEDLRIDGIMDTIDDFASQFPWMGDKNAMNDYMSKNGPAVLSGLEKELGGKKWFAGDYVTWVDFFWDTCSDGLDNCVPGFAKDYPKLRALKDRVKEIPQIAEWIKKRPPQ